MITSAASLHPGMWVIADDDTTGTPMQIAKVTVTLPPLGIGDEAVSVFHVGHRTYGAERLTLAATVAFAA